MKICDLQNPRNFLGYTPLLRSSRSHSSGICHRCPRFIDILGLVIFIGVLFILHVLVVICVPGILVVLGVLVVLGLPILLVVHGFLGAVRALGVS